MFLDNITDSKTIFNFAYPNAEIAVMGSEGAVNILYRNEMKKAQNEERVTKI